MALQTKTLVADGAKGHHRFTLTVNEDSTSIAQNTSSVSWAFVISPIKKDFDWISNAGKVKYSVAINGVTYSGIIATYDGVSTVTIASGTETCWHDAAGSLTIGYSFSITDSTGWSFAPGNASASDTMVLTDIPRQANITGAPNFNDEENPTITYTNPAGEAVEALEACISLDGSAADIAYRPVSKDGTTYTFDLTEEERDLLRNATQGPGNSRTVLFNLRTSINGTLYLSTEWRTLTIVNADPIIEPTITDTNHVTASLTGGDALIRHFSDACFTTGARAQKGAHLTAQSVTCGGVTLEGESGTFSGVQSGDFIFTATDSRGNTTILPVQLPFIDYVGLSCSIGNSKPDTDGNFTLTVSGVCYNGDIAGAGPNVLYVLYRYKINGGEYGDWYEMSVAKEDISYTATANLTGLDYRTTYIFQCKAGDLVTTATTDEVAIKAMPVFDWSGEDFSFNVPVSAPSMTLGGVSLDYVVEQSIKNDWTYRKWASGIMECWKNIVYETAVNNQLGGLYISPAATVRQNYPYSFIEKPIEVVSVQGSQPVWVISAGNGDGANSTDVSGCYHLCSPSSHDTGEHYLSFHVIGYWKYEEVNT